MTITGLKPDENAPLDPYAVKRINEWWAEIVEKVPLLKNLTSDEVETDLQSYLTEEEFQKYKKCLKKIVDWLQECKSTVNQSSLIPYCNWVFDPMYDMKLLIKQAYERKEEEARFIEALKKLEPPHEMAKLYLLPEEMQQYKLSVVDAIYAYMDKGEKFHTDKRAQEYLHWVDEIHARIEEKKKEKEAEKEFWEFNSSLISYITKLESGLCQQAKNPEVYFKNKIEDPRYKGYRFTNYLSGDDKSKCDLTIKNKVQQLEPEQFRKFMYQEYIPHYFLLPSAEYQLEDDVPGLFFFFEIFTVVEVKAWIKPKEVVINGYVFDLPQIEHKLSPVSGYYAPLKEPKFMGYRYFLLSPSELGCSLWQNIPLVLLHGLLKGEQEPAGVTISAAWDGGTEYVVEDYDEAIKIPDDFPQYLKEIGDISQLIKMGITSDKLGKIVSAKMVQITKSKIGNLSAAKQNAGFKHDEFVSSLAALHIGTKVAEALYKSTPKNLQLKDAINYAMKLFGDKKEE